MVLFHMTRALWRSAMVAGLFALHPLHVESVAWLAERKDVLSTLFFVLTIWAYVRYVERKTTIRYATSRQLTHHPLPTIPTALWYAAALVLFACGLMSKPMLVTLPCVLLLLDYWPLRRVPGSQTAGSKVERTADSGAPPQPSTFKQQAATILRLVVEKIPFFLLSLASSIITWTAQR